jgi:glutamyl-tRNA reductase
MNTIAMVGLSHRTAPLALLERVAVPASRRGDVLTAVLEAGFSEAVLLVTCSRTEIYVAGRHAHPDRLINVLAEQAGSAFATVRRTAELRVGQAAVTHLFRVTSGLESRVVGEPEIRSQVRAAFRDACAAEATGGTLGELFAGAVRLATRVHQETALGSTSRSLACRAVDLAVIGTAGADPTVLVVGSGRMASAAVNHLRCLGHRPTVVARDETRAVQLGGASHARPLSELVRLMGAADVVICTTSAVEPLVTIDGVRRAMSDRAAPLTLVDLSVPRNVDPAVAAIDGVRVVDVEAMQDRPAMGVDLAESVAKAEALVAAAVRRHRDHLAARRAGPLIAAMRQRVEAQCVEAVSRLAHPTCAPEELVRIARTVAARLAHPATMAARAAAAAGDDAALLTICGAMDVALTPEMVGLGEEELLPQCS